MLGNISGKEADIYNPFSPVEEITCLKPRKIKNIKDDLLDDEEDIEWEGDDIFIVDLFTFNR